MTPAADIFPGVRLILNDANGDRWTDAELLERVNDCLDAMVEIKPDLFNLQTTHTCISGSEQQLSVPRQVKFQEVVRVVGGGAVLPTSRQVLSAFNPNWFLLSEAPAVNWMPHDESWVKFYVYPPAPAGQHLLVRLVQKHANLTSGTDQINIPDIYAPAIQNYVIALCESKDDEVVNAARMQAFKADFAAMVGAAGGK